MPLAALVLLAPFAAAQEGLIEQPPLLDAGNGMLSPVALAESLALPPVLMSQTLTGSEQPELELARDAFVLLPSPKILVLLSEKPPSMLSDPLWANLAPLHGGPVLTYSLYREKVEGIAQKTGNGLAMYREKILEHARRRALVLLEDGEWTAAAAKALGIRPVYTGQDPRIRRLIEQAPPR